MRNAIIVHGKPGEKEYYNPKFPSASNYHWIPWLQKQLIVNEIAAQAPEIPHAFDPQYEVWEKEFERFEITPETVLVGHSCGGGFLIRWLSEHKGISVGKVVLVAPWIDPDREFTTDFFDFEIDPNIPKRAKSFTIFYSDNDDESVQKTVQIIKDNIFGCNFREFHNYGHFTHNDMKTPEFPELLKALL
ncbi:MAG: alpha/beta hydrolase [Candidatus Levybacteria bacterium]|nr:alpha/beta hydrolase [Candidatus Levybacteria bacterium]